MTTRTITWTITRLPYLLAAMLFVAVPVARAEEDVLKMVEAKRLQLKEKEDSLKREEQRLTALRKDVDEKIVAYTKLLTRAEAVLKKLEQAEDGRIDGVVKAYEVMPAEDAAARLVALDQATALRILSRMKSKRSGAIMAAMDPRKAAELTKKMTATPSVAKQQNP